jgi:hypothetical protein
MITEWFYRPNYRGGKILFAYVLFFLNDGTLTS